MKKGTSLVVQWLTPCFQGRGPGFNPWLGTRSRMQQPRDYILSLKSSCATTETWCSQINVCMYVYVCVRVYIHIYMYIMNNVKKKGKQYAKPSVFRFPSFQSLFIKDMTVFGWWVLSFLRQAMDVNLLGLLTRGTEKLQMALSPVNQGTDIFR